MRSALLIQAAAVCLMGISLVGCGQDEDVDAAPNDVFAPADPGASEEQASANLFPDPLANTAVANDAAASPVAVPQSTNVVAGPGGSASQPLVIQPTLTPVSAGQLAGAQALNAVPVPVYAPSCAPPSSKAALARYAVDCSGNARAVAPAAPSLAPAAPSNSFSPASTACDVAPRTKAGLAAYRANCMAATSAPVTAPVQQRSVTAPALPSSPATPSSDTQNTVLAPSTTILSPASPTQPADQAMSSADDASQATAAELPTLDGQPVSSDLNADAPTQVEEASAPPQSAIFDCSQDPETGAELALFRAYCQ